MAANEKPRQTAFRYPAKKSRGVWPNRLAALAWGVAKGGRALEGKGEVLNQNPAGKLIED